MDFQARSGLHNVADDALAVRDFQHDAVAQHGLLVRLLQRLRERLAMECGLMFLEKT